MENATTHDFGDGNGPVPAHRHPNPDGSFGGWVANTARVYDKAHVSRNAHVYGNAHVSGNAYVYASASVYGNARVYDSAHVHGNARVYDSAHVHGNAHVYDSAHVYGNAHVSGEARLTTGYASSTDAVRWAQIGTAPVGGVVRLFKRVGRHNGDGWPSLHDPAFVYRPGVVECPDAEESDRSCAPGLHFAGPCYWRDGDVLIAADIAVDDIITVQEGKARVRRATIIGEVTL